MRRNQTVYRAELEAVHQVIKKAKRPTAIYSDCLSVVNQLQTILNNRGSNEVAEKGDHADLWSSIEREVNSKPPEYFDVTWMPSHTEIEAAGEIEARGGIEERHVFGNHWADLLAKAGINAHKIDHEEYKRADDRAFLAATTQSLIKEVWEAYFEADQDAKDSGDFEDHNMEENHSEEPITIDEGRGNAGGQPDESDPTRQEQELPPEMALQDEWDAEEEAARWLQGEEIHTLGSSERGTVHSTGLQGPVGAGDPDAQPQEQATKRIREDEQDSPVTHSTRQEEKKKRTQPEDAERETGEADAEDEGDRHLLLQLQRQNQHLPCSPVYLPRTNPNMA